MSVEAVALISDHTVNRVGLLLRAMADDKRSREKQADDEERRQREREVAEARTRGDEAEPMRDGPVDQLGDLDEALETHDYPTTTDDLIEAYGDYQIETQDGWESLDEVLAPTDNQTYVSADDVRSQIRGHIHR
jgi:hypothetical protein